MSALGIALVIVAIFFIILGGRPNGSR